MGAIRAKDTGHTPFCIKPWWLAVAVASVAGKTRDYIKKHHVCCICIFIIYINKTKTVFEVLLIL